MLLSLALALFLAQAAGQTSPPAAQNPVDPNAKPPAKCSLEGRAVNATTGELLKKVDITLQGSGQENAMNNLSVLTGADGSFVLKDVDPGSWRLRGMRTGFATAWYGARKLSTGGTEIRLTAGQAMTDVVLKLEPQAVVTGRLTDSDGDPVAGANVSLSRSFYQNGRRVSVNAASGLTNDLGEYRIYGVTAGKYKMRATWRSFMNSGQAEEYAPTWYPGQSDAAGASTIELRAGQTLRGLDMVVQRRSTRHVRGNIIIPSSAQADFMQVMVTPRNSDEPYMPQTSVAVRASKPVFDLRLAPGSYNLNVFYNDGAGMIGAVTPVDVGDSDVDNVVIEPRPGGDITGRIRIDGATDLSAFAKNTVRVGIYPKDGVTFFGAQPGRVAEDGSFTLKNVGPQNLLVNVIGLPAGYYTKSVTYGQQDANENGFTYTGSPDILDVLVSPKGGAVTGSVHNHKGEPVSGATVVLAPPAEQRSNSRKFRVAMTDQTGKFSVKGIEPNSYTVFAWEDIEPGEYADPDLLKTMENRGKDLKIEEGAQESLDIESIPAEDTPAAF